MNEIQNERMQENAALGEAMAENLAAILAQHGAGLASLPLGNSFSPQSRRRVRLFPGRRVRASRPLRSPLNPLPTQSHKRKEHRMNDMNDATQKLKCDGGWQCCNHKVSMIGNKGYAYCDPCGIQRRQSGYERVRKLTPDELRKLQAGEALGRY